MSGSLFKLKKIYVFLFSYNLYWIWVILTKGQYFALIQAIFRKSLGNSSQHTLTWFSLPCIDID